jgi:hypothetical protein
VKGLKRSKEQVDQETAYLYFRCAELKAQVEERDAIIRLMVKDASAMETEIAGLKKLVDGEVPF